MPSVPTLLAAPAFAALLLAAPGARAQDAPFAATTLSLSAEGEVAAAPDIAVLTVGVASRGATAAAALGGMRTRMASAVAALKAQGVADRDVRTSGLSLSPVYDEGPDRPRRLTGYEASNQVTATVRDVSRAGAVLDAALAQGADTVGGVGFDLADRAPAEDAARRAAVKALGDKARLDAEAAGLHLKRLVSLTEGGAEPRPMFRTLALSATVGRTRTPIEPGELRVRETVSAVYELER